MLLFRCFCTTPVCVGVGLQEKLLTHSVQRPPYSVGIFTLHDMQQLTEYFTDTYFRHYNLYK